MVAGIRVCDVLLQSLSMPVTSRAQIDSVCSSQKAAPGRGMRRKVSMHLNQFSTADLQGLGSYIGGGRALRLAVPGLSWQPCMYGAPAIWAQHVICC